MKEETKTALAKDTLWYTASVYVAQLLGFFTGIITRKFLEPGEMGIWVLLQTFLSYSLLGELGIFTAMYCRIPAYEGEGKPEKVRLTYNAAFTFSSLVSIFVVVGFSLYAWRFGVSLSHPQRWGLALIGVLSVLTLVYNFYVCLLWAWNRFKLLGWIVMGNACLMIMGIVFLVPRFGIYGLFLINLLVPTVSALYIMNKIQLRPRWVWDAKAVADLLVYGFPLFFGGMIFTVFISLDKVMIAKLVSTEALGFYSIATIVYSFSSTAPKMLSIVLLPRMRAEYAATGSIHQVTTMVLKPDLVIAYLSPVILGMAYFLLPIFVDRILVKYEPGVQAAQILLLGSFFISLIYNVQNFLITIEKRVQSVPFLLFAVLAAVLLNMGLIQAGFGIGGVALGMSLAFFIYFLSLSYYVLRHFFSHRGALRHIAEILFIFVYFVLCLYGIERWIPGSFQISRMMIRCMVFLITCLPLVYIAEQRLGVFQYGWRIFKKKGVEVAA